MLILPANFEARLSIFYSDFRTRDTNDIEIIEPPDVNESDLRAAIEGLENLVNQQSFRAYVASNMA